MSLFVDDIIVYIKNSQESTKIKTLFELLMEYIMLSGYINKHLNVNCNCIY